METNLEKSASDGVSSKIIDVKDAFDLIRPFKGICFYSFANLLVERIAFSKVVKPEDVFDFRTGNWRDIILFVGKNTFPEELSESVQRINEQYPEYSPVKEINGWRIIYSYKPRPLDSILLQDIQSILGR
jgi:hypothetical protein